MLAAATITFAIPAPRAINEDRLLDCIARTENWDGRTAGRSGEWGDFQMIPSTWRAYSPKPIRLATKAEWREGARKHLSWLKRSLTANHCDVTVFTLALAWNAGAHAVGRKTCPAEKLAYADRCEALYEEAGR